MHQKLTKLKQVEYWGEDFQQQFKGYQSLIILPQKIKHINCHFATQTKTAHATNYQNYRFLLSDPDFFNRVVFLEMIRSYFI